MHKDALVEEVRRIRREIEQECQENPDRLFEHYQSVQEKISTRLVRRSPKPLQALPPIEKAG